MVHRQDIPVIPNESVEYHGQLIINAIESMGDAFFILDRDFKFVQVNKTYEELSGVKRADTIGKSIWEVFPHTEHPDTLCWIHFHAVINTKMPASFVMLTKRFQVWVEVNASPTRSGGISVFVHDITARLHAEQALLESERRFRALLSANSDIIYQMSPDWTEMRQLDGRNFMEDTGTTNKNWMEKYIPKNEKSRVKKAVNDAIKQKEMFQLDHQVYLADGSIGWVLSRAVPILDDDGNIIEWFGNVTDITERRQRLETEQRMQVLTEQRNALMKINDTKDEFIALASHQLRTPATAVKQYIGMMLANFTGPLSPQQISFLQTAYDSNERELKIINDLLRTAQIDGSMPSAVATEMYDIAGLVREVIADLQPTIDQNDQTVHFDCNLKPIKMRMDVTEMKLALSNLIENASKYSPLKSEITVGISRTDEIIKIAVIDQGVGISTDDQERVFDKFTRGYNEYTESVSGTGLGLYWVKQIAEMHGGNIELISRFGKGSTFTMNLPIATK